MWLSDSAEEIVAERLGLLIGAEPAGNSYTVLYTVLVLSAGGGGRLQP